MANDQQAQATDAPSNGSTPDAETAALAIAPPGAIAPTGESITNPFSSIASFEAALRMAKLLASTALVPTIYRNNIANCVLALEIASRVGVSVFVAMQNLDIIQGKPGWSSKFLIATVNASGRFTPLRYEWGGVPGQDSWACRAVAKDRQSGEVLEGTWITWLMAKKEGWVSKNGSKWQTMPEQMFRYRAAAFWQRAYAPEIGLGLHTSEELQDMSGAAMPEGHELPAQLSPGVAASLEAVLGMQRSAADAVADAEIVVVPEHAGTASEPEQTGMPGMDKPRRGRS